MAVTISIVVLVLLAAVFYIMRRGQKQPAQQARPTKSSAKSTEFHAVSISFGSGACQAAIELDGKRFLSGEAPKIPLPDCEAAECTCTFKHYQDRRQTEDRRNPYRSTIAGESGVYKTDLRKLDERRDDPPDDIFDDKDL